MQVPAPPATCSPESYLSTLENDVKRSLQRIAVSQGLHNVSVSMAVVERMDAFSTLVFVCRFVAGVGSSVTPAELQSQLQVELQAVVTDTCSRLGGGAATPATDGQWGGTPQVHPFLQRSVSA